MEKQRNTKRRRSFFRLLILFLVLFSSGNAFAAPRLTYADIVSLRVTPDEGEKLMTARDIKFVLEIPYVDPKKVDVETPDSKNDIVFKTMKKGASFDSGTRIELWYEFLSPGSFKPNYLTVRINNWPYTIQFNKVEIEEDPAAQKPRMIIKFSNDASCSSFVRNYRNSLFNLPATETVNFTVYLQYAIQVLNFDYEIPKNALLVNTNLHEITEVKYRQKEYSHDLLPVADFEWTPLLPGETRIPVIKMKAIAYDGTRQDIMSPNCVISVLPGEHAETENTTEFSFDEAFEFTELEEYTPQNEIKSEDIFEKIDLRKKRIIYFIFILFGIFAVTCVLMMILKIKTPYPYVIISLFLVLLLFCFIKIYKQKTAVYSSGTLYAIPEETAENHFTLAENTEVKIIKETSDWICIQSGENIGWTKKENIILY